MTCYKSATDAHLAHEYISLFRCLDSVFDERQTARQTMTAVALILFIVSVARGATAPPDAERSRARPCRLAWAEYLLSGVSLAADADRQARANYLRDAYRYTPSTAGGRLQLAARRRPRPSGVQPSSSWAATTARDSVFSPPPSTQDSPGVPSVAMARRAAGRARRASVLRVERAHRSLASAVILPGGEVRPGVRSPEVWSLAFPGSPVGACGAGVPPAFSGRRDACTTTWGLASGAKGSERECSR